MPKLFSPKLFLTLLFLGLCLIGPNTYANPLADISSANIEKAIAPLQKISEKELINQLNDNSKNSYLGPVLQKFPILAVFMVRMIRDQQALPNLAKILENRDRLIHFAYWMLGSFVLGVIITFLFKRSGSGIIESMLNYILRFALMFSIRIFIIYYFFAAELAPSVKVFTKTFF